MKKNIIILTVFLFGLSACQVNPETANGQEEHQHEAEGHHESEVHLTTEQVKTIGLQLGRFTAVKMSDYVKATGVLDVPPNEISSINAPEVGFIRHLQKYIVGSYVAKGAVIAYLEHPKYFEKQQEYLELKSELIYLEQEKNRQQQLSEANASALKAYQKIQSEYGVKQARLKGIEQYLNYLGIDLKALEQGQYTKQIKLIAPKSGHVMFIDVHNGMLALPEKELMRILSNDHIHLELDVFESDMNKVKMGQKVAFTMSNDPSTIYEGEIHEISPSFNAENKTLRVHAHVVGKPPKFVQGAFLEATIWLNDATIACLPESAIASADGQDFVFVYKGKHGEEATFQAIPVSIKQRDKGWVVLENNSKLPTDDKIVTKAAFYLIAEMNKSEHAHHH